MMDKKTEVSICIFSARETFYSLAGTIAAAIVAAPKKSVIDVLVNGNPNLAEDAAKHVKLLNHSRNSPLVRVWRIAVGDKAHAWNQHMHHIWETGSAFYIDGYVRLKHNSINILRSCMHAHPGALGGTGVPSVGRSAEGLRAQLLKNGGFHGNLCCISEASLRVIKDRKINLPLGLYRVDSLMGAILSFGFDPRKFDWNPRKFIAVAQGATWDVDKKSLFKFSDIKSSIKRFIRQAQGDLENKAVRHHFVTKKHLPAMLPKTIAELVISWVDGPHDAAPISRFKPMVRHALESLRKPKDWSGTRFAPVLLGSSTPDLPPNPWTSTHTPDSTSSPRRRSDTTLMRWSKK